jgi:type IV pilus assembly protein PilM
MSMTPFWKKRTAIGVDIGSRMMKAAQLEREGTSYRISAMSLTPRIHPQSEIDRQEVLHLRHVLKHQGFVGRDIVLAVPDDLLLRGVFELPPKVSGASSVQVARMELARIHQLDPEAFEMVHWSLSHQGISSPGAQTVVVACPHKAAHTLLDTFERHGWNVTALDVRTAAAARACEPLCASPPAITAMLDLGWSSTKLLLVCGHTVVYERFLKTELSRLTTQLSKEFHIDLGAACQLVDSIGIEEERVDASFDQASVNVIHAFIRRHVQTIVEELTIPFSYINRQYAGEGITRLLLLGGGACVPGIANYLASVLKMEVRGTAPRDIIHDAVANVSSPDDPTMTVAVGLAKFSDEEPPCRM